MLSHLTAARFWELPAPPETEVHVTVLRGTGPRRARIRAHVSRALGDEDLRRRNRLPVTAASRTLLDLAQLLSLRDLERAFDEARQRRLVSRESLANRLRASARPGVARLRALLEREAEPLLTRSEAEERFLVLIRKAGLPAPRVNARVLSYEVDFLWTAERLVVEVDGFAFHSTRAAFERDRRRDAALQATGLRVMRVTWRQITGEPEAVLVRIAQALVASGRAPGRDVSGVDP